MGMSAFFETNAIARRVLTPVTHGKERGRQRKFMHKTTPVSVRKALAGGAQLTISANQSVDGGTEGRGGGGNTLLYYMYRTVTVLTVDRYFLGLPGWAKE